VLYNAPGGLYDRGSVLYFLLLFAVLVGIVVFAALNPGNVELDLAFGRVEVAKPLALTAAFGAGWLFGVLCAAVVLLRSANERRRLRKSLRVAEAEARAARSLPLHDAD